MLCAVSVADIRNVEVCQLLCVGVEMVYVVDYGTLSPLPLYGWHILSITVKRGVRQMLWCVTMVRRWSIDERVCWHGKHKVLVVGCHAIIGVMGGK
jgi:hypothetical protein